MTRRVAGRARDGSPLRPLPKIPPDPGAVRDILRKAGRLEPSVLVGLLATAPAVANVPAIWTAAANLQAGVGGRLDKGANNVLTGLINASGQRWIAEDQKAFADAVAVLRTHLDVLRTNVQWAAGHVDGIGDGFLVYWGAALKIAQETYLRLAALRVLALAPQTRVAARIAMRRTGAQASAALAASTERLGRFLGSLGFKDVLGGVAAGIGGSAAVQLAFMRPDGGAAVDFTEAAAGTARAGTFAEPEPGTPLPDAARSFDWRVRAPGGDMSLDDVVRDRS
ncbi:hypothetical protein FE391_30125 [Nonomuraea sp. KC401]|uniref:hypothetical protein n=1 Tax=unclassified Nonomuraea TaxID=2593643 RepID=UPI0010FE691A|nr:MULTISPECIES: hypothetical protein [unclassified Nonomuraea]NBE97386.1 hypothetical protein [Nonomuraea sp. K271]TLF62415.1 hypothetical protein FE391_30125 [Nonomuraea sp. KC401]